MIQRNSQCDNVFSMRVLAGPIVRRVEPRLAAIWVATDVACAITLQIWNDIQSASSLPAEQFKATAHTLAAGDGLHIGLVVADLTGAPLPLVPEVVYSYNLTFLTDKGENASLQSLKLLQDQDGPRPHLALGYGADVLPGFVLPPRQLKDLKILHGSCRRVGADGPDAMRWIDDFIGSAKTDAIARPHQLFLTGDQIYADNLPTVMQYELTPIANTLMGSVEALPTRFGMDAATSAVKLIPCDLANFPAGLRKNVVMHDARLSTSDGTNHLLSFGEFCAMHLMAWSNELWPDPDALHDAKSVFADCKADPPEIWALHLALLGGYPALAKAPDITKPTGDKTLGALTHFGMAEANQILGYFKADKSKQLDDYNDELRVTKDFMAGLPRVRRALANIATYMIFDDHEITDDWNFARIWKDRVMSSPLGRTVLRNGLMAYTLFQGWGNDPKQFIDDVRDLQGAVAKSPQKQLLEAIPQMFPVGEPDPPVSALADKIDSLLGLGIDTGAPVNPATDGLPLVTWHYRGSRVQAPGAGPGRPHAPHLHGANSPSPQNLSDDAVKAQLPTDTDPDLITLSPEIDVVLVISSLVVMGPPVFDSLFGPLSYKYYDAKDHKDNVALPATDPDAIESWPNDPVGFERLMTALQPLKRVVLLSGDVHYATSVVMSYWKDRFKPPSRFAQFICSALRNNFDDRLAMADQDTGYFSAGAAIGCGSGATGVDELRRRPAEYSGGREAAARSRRAFAGGADHAADADAGLASGDQRESQVSSGLVLADAHPSRRAAGFGASAGGERRAALSRQRAA